MRTDWIYNTEIRRWVAIESFPLTEQICYKMQALYHSSECQNVDLLILLILWIIFNTANLKNVWRVVPAVTLIETFEI